MNKKKYLSLFLIVVILGCASASSFFSTNTNTILNGTAAHDIIYVSPLGDDIAGDGSFTKPFQTLSKAVSVVKENGVVHIANGEYNNESNRNMNITKNMEIIHDKTLAGLGNSTQINAEHSGYIFSVQNVNFFKINGIKFLNTKNDYGGVLSGDDGSHVTVVNSEFRDNYADIAGGAIATSGDLNLINCQFIKNQAGNDERSYDEFNEHGMGGAILATGNLMINNCQFKNNHAGNEQEGLGGAITCTGKSTIFNTEFLSNTAGSLEIKGGGGAIYNIGNVDIGNSTFISNVGGIGGGAIYNKNNTLNIENSNFKENRADQFGGAIVNSAKVTLTNCRGSGNGADYGGFLHNGAENKNNTEICIVKDSVFTDNHANKNGSVIYSNKISSTDINGCTLTSNDATGDGGAVFNKGDLNIGGTSITFNKADNGGGIYNTFDGALNITKSFINKNTVKKDGGGVYSQGKLSNDQDSLLLENTPENIIKDIIYVTEWGNDKNDGLSPDKPKRTIQNGIDSVKKEGTVLVKDGFYKESITINKNMELIGDNPNNTLLAGLKYNDARGIYVKNYDVKIKRLNIHNTRVWGDGSGIYNNGILTLINVVIRGNSAGGCGGGIYNNNNLTIINSTIISNEAMWIDRRYGGGIYNNGELTLIDSGVYGNRAYYGSGIYNNKVLTVINSVIRTNKVPISTSTSYGGGIYNNEKLKLIDSTLTDNTATYGAGIYNDKNCLLNMIKTKIGENKATTQGGGIYNLGKITQDQQTITINNIPDSIFEYYKK